MKIKNCLKILPVVLLISGCSSLDESKFDNIPYYTYTSINVGEQISYDEFISGSSSLKNNYEDYSKLYETFVVEEIEAEGEYSEKIVGQAIRGYAPNEANYLEADYTVITKFSPSSDLTSTGLINALGDAVSYYNIEYFKNGDRFTIKMNLKTGVNYYKVQFINYFDESGLIERCDFSTSCFFDKNDKFSALYVFYYTRVK